MEEEALEERQSGDESGNVEANGGALQFAVGAAFQKIVYSIQYISRFSSFPGWFSNGVLSRLWTRNWTRGLAAPRVLTSRGAPHTQAYRPSDRALRSAPAHVRGSSRSSETAQRLLAPEPRRAQSTY